MTILPLVSFSAATRTAEYALGGLSNNIFASRYVLYTPNKDQLIAPVENDLKKWHKEDPDE